MASVEALGLPDWLAERFARWIEWYDDYLPERPDAFPWEKFKAEGQILAFELARFVGDDTKLNTTADRSSSFRSLTVSGKAGRRGARTPTGPDQKRNCKELRNG